MKTGYNQPIDTEREKKFVTALRAALDEFRTHTKRCNPGLERQFDAATLQTLEFLRKNLRENPHTSSGSIIIGAAEALVSFIGETQIPKVKAENTERRNVKSS